MAADEVRAGNVTGKAEVSAWIARRANVTLGDEWDRALQICAEYLESAGESDEEIVRALNEIAGAIAPAQAGFSHIVEVAPAVEPGEVSDSETETEEVAALPPGDSDNAENQSDAQNPEPVLAIKGSQPTAVAPSVGRDDNAENQNDVRNCPNGTCPGVGGRAAGNAGGYYQRYGYGWFW